MAFTQTITVRADSADSLEALLESWDRDQRETAPGYQAARLLADEDQPGRYVIEVDFASRDEARQNNTRAETQAWADKLKGEIQGPPEYGNFSVAYTSR
jgi:quinol monooxygenase YgiN